VDMSQFHFKQEKRWNDSRVYWRNRKNFGDKFLYIPSHLAYGAGGAGNVIPPDMIFEVELLQNSLKQFTILI
jgi:hypothetical protein